MAKVNGKFRSLLSGNMLRFPKQRRGPGPTYHHRPDDFSHFVKCISSSKTGKPIRQNFSHTSNNCSTLE